MHSTAVFASTDFDIVDRGQATTHARYFSGFARTERLGLFAPDGCEGAGATILVMACVTAFYDRYREEGGDFFAYPDFFSFQRRQPPASYAMFDIWPGHKDVSGSRKEPTKPPRPSPTAASASCCYRTGRRGTTSFTGCRWPAWSATSNDVCCTRRKGRWGSPPSRSPPRRRSRSAIGRKGCSTRWRGMPNGRGGASASSTQCRWTGPARASGRSLSSRLIRCCSRRGRSWLGRVAGTGTDSRDGEGGRARGQAGRLEG